MTTIEEMVETLERIAGADIPKLNPNQGHGHVYPRPDGVRARCGGPSMCGECAIDFVKRQTDRERGVFVPRELLVAVIAQLKGPTP